MLPPGLCCVPLLVGRRRLNWLGACEAPRITFLNWLCCWKKKVTFWQAYILRQSPCHQVMGVFWPLPPWRSGPVSKGRDWVHGCCVLALRKRAGWVMTPCSYWVIRRIIPVSVFDRLRNGGSGSRQKFPMRLSWPCPCGMEPWITGAEPWFMRPVSDWRARTSRPPGPGKARVSR